MSCPLESCNASFFYLPCSTCAPLSSSPLPSRPPQLPADAVSSIYFAPFEAQYTLCKTALTLPVTPTAQQLLSACSYSICTKWFSQVATLSCTVNGHSATIFGNLCNGAGLFVSTGSLTTNPPSLRSTSTPPSSSTGPNAPSIRRFGHRQPHHGPPSQVVHIHLVPSVGQSLCQLTCTIDGDPASNVATLYDDSLGLTATITAKPTIASKPLTTFSTTSSGTSECSDTELAFNTPLAKKCKLDYGIMDVTSALLPLWCSYDSCVKQTKAYATLTCTIDGEPVSP
ncbi:Aste57867_13790 [Aphanomyces stellatus]|uniref:Aste57867_13790 protein n=1 Tax=Aphanomyces stellatus TaxID=120398 RepID=A0A485L170_9STRA|nr:hypothetical protein As57867_013740 [Aphanomyces stellatus]VFT90622.1 Aste57867_13790 [Aphanomyces stellatus]